MQAFVKICLLFGLTVCFLTKVDGKHHKILRRNTEVKDSEIKHEATGRRGILGNLISGIVSPTNQLPMVDNSPINLPSPIFSVDQPLAPTFQIPNEVPAAQIVQQSRPSLISGLISNIFNSREQQPQVMQNPYNNNWIKYAMQKCGRVDPRTLTAVLPTASNGLTVPKIYYFQNETKLTWTRAQEFCTQKGMNLLTVNDAAENRIIIDKLRQIMAGNTPGTTTAPATPGDPPVIDPNTNAFWIGLNNFNADGVRTWVGDGTSSFSDLFAGEPDPAANFCGTYNQVTSVDNIHMDGVECDAALQPPLRFICEVSDECMALYMSRFPTSYFHQTNYNNGFNNIQNHHNGHVHYNPGGILPPI